MFSDDDAPTARIYRTDVGNVDWERASEAASRVADGSAEPIDRRVLSALFTRVFRDTRLVNTSGAGIFDGVRAAQLLGRLVDAPHADDVDALWSLLFKVFDRA